MDNPRNLKAYTKGNNREWILTPYYREGEGNRPILVLYGPWVSYYLEAFDHFQDTPELDFCIDAMGRNFGAGEGNSVYVKVGDVHNWMRDNPYLMRG